MIQIIPAIDLIGGKCVRLTQGDFSQQKTYSSDPVEAAKMFEQAGYTHLHLVDLEGAKAGKIVHLNLLKKIAAATTLKIDFGGGIKHYDDLLAVFDHGASQANIGSIAVQQKALFSKWLSEFGPDKLILSADTRAGMVAINGWETNTTVAISDLLYEYKTEGIKYVCCTDISKDGLLQGPATVLYQSLRQAFPDLHLIASGGVSSPADIEALNKLELYGVIIGKAFYEGLIPLGTTVH